MEDTRHRQNSLTLRNLVLSFNILDRWPITIEKLEGSLTITAGELVRRIDKRYLPEPAA